MPANMFFKLAVFRRAGMALFTLRCLYELPNIMKFIDLQGILYPTAFTFRRIEYTSFDTDLFSISCYYPCLPLPM